MDTLTLPASDVRLLALAVGFVLDTLDGGTNITLLSDAEAARPQLDALLAVLVAADA